MLCEYVIESKCDRGHRVRRKCYQSKQPDCWTCKREEEKRQRQLKIELDRQSRRDRSQAEHNAKLVELDRQIEDMREKLTDTVTNEENSRALEQKRRDLEAAIKVARETSRMDSKALADRVRSQIPSHLPATSIEASPPITSKEDASQEEGDKIQNIKNKSELEWERQKRVEGADNVAIDSLMSLTGLEDVKAKILTIKAKIETVRRQGADMKKERLGLVLLGNPGTGEFLFRLCASTDVVGKTTIARLYAQFLTSVDVLPGTEFFETTASRLANEGVAGAKKHVETILNAGGGAFFVDEAYQLANGHNMGGSSVLDFLLAEIENQVGKIVFILAGYSKQMEKFFEHNPGFDSRIPHRLTFADYTDAELLLMLRRLVDKKYNGRAKLEGGATGLYPSHRRQAPRTRPRPRRLRQRPRARERLGQDLRAPGAASAERASRRCWTCARRLSLLPRGPHRPGAGGSGT